MLSFLEDIAHGIASIPFWIADGAVQVINMFVAAFGLLIKGIFLILPAMPARPKLPSDGVVGFLNWLFPAEAFIANALVGIGLLTVFFLSQVALRWGKAD